MSGFEMDGYVDSALIFPVWKSGVFLSELMPGKLVSFDPACESLDRAGIIRA